MCCLYMFLENVYFTWMHLSVIYVNGVCYYILYSGVHFSYTAWSEALLGCSLTSSLQLHILWPAPASFCLPALLGSNLRTVSINNASVNILIHGPFWACVGMSLGCIPWNQIVGSRDVWTLKLSTVWPRPSSPSYTWYQIPSPPYLYHT